MSAAATRVCRDSAGLVHKCVDKCTRAPVGVSDLARSRMLLGLRASECEHMCPWARARGCWRSEREGVRVCVCLRVRARVLTLKCPEGLDGQHSPPDGREAPAQAAGGREEHLLPAQRDDALRTCTGSSAREPCPPGARPSRSVFWHGKAMCPAITENRAVLSPTPSDNAGLKVRFLLQQSAMPPGPG